MMSVLVSFILGSMFGAMVGFMMFALLSVAKESDKHIEDMKEVE